MLADYVLPPTMALEREDHTGLSERSVGSRYAQWTGPALEPPAGVREDWDYLHEPGHHPGLTLEMVGQRFAPEMQRPSSRDLLNWAAGHGSVKPDVVRDHPHGFVPSGPEPRVLATDDDTGHFTLMPRDVREERRWPVSPRRAGGGMRPC